MDKEYKHIVFFDGECGLCQSSIQFLYKIDTNQQLYFSPLQGKTAKSLLPDDRMLDLDTLYFFSSDKLYSKSDAIFAILSLQAGFWRVFTVFKFLPLFIRDKAYDFVARRRLFFKKKECLYVDRLLD